VGIGHPFLLTPKAAPHVVARCSFSDRRFPFPKGDMLAAILRKTTQPPKNIKHVCTLTSHSTSKAEGFPQEIKHVEH
jgi:hypothetical protein